jgi:hypothetical protein
MCETSKFRGERPQEGVNFRNQSRIKEVADQQIALEKA